MNRVLNLTFVAALGALFTGCVVVPEDNVPPPDPPPAGPSYHAADEFALDAGATSEGQPGSLDYSALQATGAPDVDACTDSPRAWSPYASNPNPGVTPAGSPVDDILDVGFADYQWVQQIKIYETYAPGAIVRVDLVASDDSAPPLTVYENYDGDGPAPCPSAFVIDLGGETSLQYDRVQIYLDENLTGDFNGDGSMGNDYNEIDAVEMIGETYY